MSMFVAKRYFRYLAILYLKNVLVILFGLSFAFAGIDYFQSLHKLHVSGSYQVLYIYYIWEQALGLLYPLAIVFGLIMTLVMLIRHHTLGALHAFGYTKRVLFAPFVCVACCIYAIFIVLHTTEFSYASDKSMLLLKDELNNYNVNNLFFKYNDTFVYIKKLDPIAKTITDITIFKVTDHQIKYTMKAHIAYFHGNTWNAKNVTIKRHIYSKGKLIRYSVEHQKNIQTLQGYKPKIIESLYEAKALNIIDAYHTWKLLSIQGLNSDKIRAVFYEKTILPLFALALLSIIFFKFPFHMRMMNLGLVISVSMAGTSIVWGILIGLQQIGFNGVVLPEMTSILPIGCLLLYALYISLFKKYQF